MHARDIGLVNDHRVVAVRPRPHVRRAAADGERQATLRRDAARQNPDQFDGVELVKAELPPSIADERPIGDTNSEFLERVFQKDVDDG